MSDESSLFWLGVVFCGSLFLFVGQFTESICQSENDVADCEWSRSPFTPVIPDTSNQRGQK